MAGLYVDTSALGRVPLREPDVRSERVGREPRDASLQAIPGEKPGADAQRPGAGAPSRACVPCEASCAELAMPSSR
jgi:hypothetical protein